MEIAKGISASDYNQLDLVNFANSDWKTAFHHLNKRLNNRYIEPIEILRAFEKDKPAIEKKFGFTILAIDCLLIETIQSFYEGIVDSAGKSQRLFKNFLTQHNYLKSYFPAKDLAGDFYKYFRCGILHQSQTFGNTKIWTIGKLVEKQGNFLVVIREAFHDAVINEKEIYLNSLKNKIMNIT